MPCGPGAAVAADGDRPGWQRLQAVGVPPWPAPGRPGVTWHSLTAHLGAAYRGAIRFAPVRLLRGLSTYLAAVDAYQPYLEFQ